jgi:transcriptional regulator with XRE-family HTH domain
MLWYVVSTNRAKGVTVGGELRRWRNAANMNQRQVGESIGKSHVTIGRYERGELVPQPEDLSAMLAVMDVPVESREETLALARAANDSHWLAMGMPEQHRQLTALVDIESEALSISTVSPLLVPGMLQTGAYVRSMMERGGVPKHEIATRVAVRVGRRDAITRNSSPVHLNAFIGESVLHQVIGSPQTMLEQLDFLVEMSERPNVDLRVIPMNSDWHPGMDGPFSLAEFAEEDPVVHLENRISGLFLQEPAEVKVYQEAVDKVRDAAMSPDATSGLIANAIKKTGEMTA